MMLEDICIWQKFISNGEFLPDKVWYDLHLGRPILIDKSLPEWMHKMNSGIGRKRVDVIGQVGPDYWVIEIKPLATYDAYGQVIFYADLFSREYQVITNVIPVILTDRCDYDIISLASRTGVLILETSPENDKNRN